MLQAVLRMTLSPILVVAIFLAGFAQNVSQDSSPKHDGKIAVTFDNVNNETTIRLAEMLILENKSESLSMVLVGSFSGNKPSGSRSEILLVLKVSSGQKRFQSEPLLVVTADGEIIRTREMKNYGSQRVGDRVVEPLLTMVPFDIVERVARAKRVVFKINNNEYELTANNLEAVLDFIGRLIPEKTGP